MFGVGFKRSPSNHLGLAACVALAALGGCGSKSSGTGDFASSTQSTATATPAAGVRANGVETATIAIVIRRPNGSPVVGRTVEVTATGTNNLIVQPAVTDANGMTSGTIASTTAETKTLTITVFAGPHGIVLAQHPLVEFVDDSPPISAGLSTATASPATGLLADGETTSTITVTVRNATGAVVAGQSVLLSSTGSNNTLVQPGLTDENGVATGTIATTTAETKTITATVNPGPSQVVVAQQPTVLFTGQPSSLQTTATASPDTNVVANGTTTSTITVTVRDGNGDAIAGQTVLLAASGSNNTLVQPGVTDASGVATGTIASTTAETKTITATVSPGAGQVVVAQQPTVAFVGDPSTIDELQTTATASPAVGVVADGSTTSTITVTVRDVNGNPVAGQAVLLTSSGSNNTLVQPGVTDQNGVTTGSLASIMAETKVVTATANPGPSQVVISQQPTVVFVGDPASLSALLSTAVASPATGVVADGSTASTITVTVRDVNGNPVGGQAVQLASTGSNNTLVQPGVTNATGVATGSVASTRAETKTITATINPGASQVVSAQQPTVVFVGDPNNVSALLTTAAASPTAGVVADGVVTSTVTVTVRDVNGNPVAGLGVALTSTGSNNTLVQPGVTDASGVATGSLASIKAETKTITATVNSGAGPVVAEQQPTVVFVGDPDNISAGLSTAVASPASNVDADGVTTSTITVTVRDINGNPVGSQTVLLSSSGSSNTLVQPGATDGNGVAAGTIATMTAETKLITATVNPGAGQVVIAQQPTVAFVPPVVSALLSTVVVSPAFGLAADGAATATISITVRSTNNVLLSGRSLLLAATGAGNTLVQPGTTNGGGAATGSIRSTVGETKTLTVTADPGVGQVVLAARPTVSFVAINGKVFYVRKSGSDSNAGTSPAAAWATLGKAANTMVAGDIVHVGAGIYAEALVIQANGTSTNRITYRADVTGACTGDAGAVVVTQPAGSAIHVDSADNITIEGFTLIDSQVGVRMGNGPIGIIVRDCTAYDCTTGIIVESGTPVVLEHNRISNNVDGITVQAGTLTIRNNLVYNNGGYGIAIISGSITVIANTVHGNANSNLRFTGGNTTVANNIVTNSLTTGFDRRSGTVVGSYNLVWGNATNYNGLSPGTGDVSLNPFFVDVDGADNLLGGANCADDRFLLDHTLSSPALDAGSAAATTFALADGSALADRTSRTDSGLDGTTPDGTTVNMGFHYGAATTSPPGLLVNDVRLFYGEGSVRQPRVRTWDDVGASWSAEGTALPAGSTIQWTQHVVSPLLNDIGLCAVLSVNGSSTELDMLRWNGTEWSLDWTSTSIAAAHAQKRGFDLAFEQSTGDALVVYSNNTNQPRYRTRVNGAWSAEAAVSTAPLAGVVQWVQLAARPGSSEIVLCYSDSISDLAVLVWSGTAWTAATSSVLETNLKTNSSTAAISNRVFDVAYEATTGDVLVAWSRSAANGFWYSTKAAGSNTWSVPAQQSAAPTSGIPHFVDLASEPGGSRIACCALSLDGQERLGLATWTGSAWVNAGEYDAQIRDVDNTATGDFPAAVAWVGSSGTAVCVYADDETGTLDWVSWTAAGGWVVQSDVAIAGKGYTESVDLQAFANVADVMLVVADSNSDLYALTCDGTAWTITNGGGTLETSLPSLASKPFSFAVKPQ
ncbi:MAG TPA: Ig-like domain-containing protein [Planctomycetota bacterium]